MARDDSAITDMVLWPEIDGTVVYISRDEATARALQRGALFVAQHWRASLMIGAGVAGIMFLTSPSENATRRKTRR